MKNILTGIRPTGNLHLGHLFGATKNWVNLQDKFNVGDIINVKVIEVDEDKSHVKLSIKKIDYKVEETLSMIPESGSGFGMLKSNLERWTSKKIAEINKKIN